MLIAYMLISATLAIGQAPATAPAPADANEVVLSVTVVDANNAPVPAAEVRALGYPDEGGGRYVDRGRATADAEGKASFHWRASDTSRIFGFVIAHRDGLALGWSSYLGAGRSEISLPLDKPLSLGGVVVDDANSPIRGAEVAAQLVGPAGSAVGYEGLEWLFRTTDDRGRFRFDEIPPGAWAGFIARAPGRAKTITMEPGHCNIRPPRSHVRIVMKPEARVEGIAVDQQTQKPIAGVRIVATSVQIDRGQVAATGPDGRFVLGNLPGVELTLNVRRPGYCLQDWVCPSAKVQTEAGKAASVKLELTKGGILEVLVTDSKTHAPVAGATVGVTTSDDHGSGCFGRSDANGLAQIRVLPGTVTIADAHADGYKPLPDRFRTAISRSNGAAGGVSIGSVADAPTGVRPINIAAGQTRRVPIALDPMPRIRGIVRDDQGKPLAGAAIQSGMGVLGTSGLDGNFDLPLPYNWRGEDIPAVVFVRHERRGLVGRIDVPRDEKPVDVKLAAAPPAFVVKAVDPNGAPIGGAEVQIVIWTGNSGMSQGRQPRTGPDGTLKLDDLFPGQKYALCVHAPGYGEVQQSLTPEEAGPQPALEPFILPLARLTISGVVLDANDSPVSNATVYVTGPKQYQQNARTDQQGRFSLGNIIEGPVSVTGQFTGPGGDSWYGNVRCKGGDTGVRIALKQRADAGGVYRSVANQPRPLTGKPLPKLDALGLGDALGKAAGRRVLLCFWDMDQRPSRRCIQILQARLAEIAAARSGTPAAGVTVLSVQSAETGADQLKKWLADNKITIPAGNLPAGEAGQKLRAAFDVRSLPWLILTDDKHVVRAEGFAVEELAGKLSAGPATRPAAPG
jgi:protocatechuate 3,4-dioxygenase beta subunit